MKCGKQGCSRERGKCDRKVFILTIHSSHLCLPILAKRINMELSELDKRSNMLGFSVKVKSLRKPPFIFFLPQVWQLAWDAEQREFKSSKSSVFIFQDRSPEDLPYIQTVIKSLAGDGSLDDVFDSTIGLLDGDAVPEQQVPKGEVVVAKGEPKGEIAEPLVKMEVEEALSDEEDSQDMKGFIDDNDEDDGEDDDDYNADEDYEGDSGEAEDDNDVGAEDAESTEVEMCDKCGRTYIKRAHFLKHLQQCNPAQIEGLAPKYTLRQQAKIRASVVDLRSSKESVEKRKVTLAQIRESCNRCERVFKHRSFLIHHLKTCNPDQIQELLKQKMSPKVAKKLKSILADDSSLQCKYCPRLFTFKKSLMKHEHLHETDPSHPTLDPCKLKREKRRYDKSALRVPMGNYQCDKCSSSFKLYAALERHMEAHMLAATARPEDKQDELADRGIGLKTNEIRDGVMMRCIKCDLVYSTRGMYQQHMKQYHSKQMACEECGKRFTLPNSLNTHRLNHHTSFPKDCEDCGQFQATKKEYLEHMKKAHGQVGLRKKGKERERTAKRERGLMNVAEIIIFCYRADQIPPCLVKFAANWSRANTA